MKKIIALIIAVFLLNTLFGQKNLEEKEPIYFLLGTIDDYMGRRLSYLKNDEVDSYYPDEKRLPKKINKLFIKSYPDIKLQEENGGKKIICKELNKEINKFYSFTNEYYVGVLKENIFETEEQKYAYLVGAYTRFGNKDKGKYVIYLANSGNKFLTCQKLLEELGCEFECESIDLIPRNNIIYFTPTKQLKQYLSNLVYKNKGIKS